MRLLRQQDNPRRVQVLRHQVALRVVFSRRSNKVSVVALRAVSLAGNLDTDNRRADSLVASVNLADNPVALVSRADNRDTDNRKADSLADSVNPADSLAATDNRRADSLVASVSRPDSLAVTDNRRADSLVASVSRPDNRDTDNRRADSLVVSDSLQAVRVTDSPPASPVVSDNRADSPATASRRDNPVASVSSPDIRRRRIRSQRRSRIFPVRSTTWRASSRSRHPAPSSGSR